MTKQCHNQQDARLAFEPLCKHATIILHTPDFPIPWRLRDFSADIAGNCLPTLFKCLLAGLKAHLLQMHGQTSRLLKPALDSDDDEWAACTVCGGCGVCKLFAEALAKRWGK